MRIKVESREYKLLLDQREFRDRKAGVETFVAEMARLAAPVPLEGEFGSPEKRSLVFLDSPDLTIRRLGLILRHRKGEDAGELTLKCRSEDRYFAAGTDLFDDEKPGKGEKFEEDVATPFVSRFSKSKTVASDAVATWAEAVARFPILGRLTLDGRPLAGDVPLTPVRGVRVFERVYRGPKLHFEDPARKEKTVDATLALILWSEGKDGRTIVAELSFRLKDEDEAYSRRLAEEARGVFDRLRRHDWTLPSGRTKTQYVYGDPGVD